MPKLMIGKGKTMPVMPVKKPVKKPVCGFILLALIGGCVSSTSTPGAGDELSGIFAAALLDAQNPRPERIVDTLTPIQGNTDLIRKSIDGTAYLLAVSWKNKDFFPQPGERYNTGQRDIWVTVAPQMQERCREILATSRDPLLRLRQLLGLEPYTPEVFFLSVWVREEDLFRPCPDPETHDTACGLAFPVNVIPEHRRWINELRAKQYVDCDDVEFDQGGYPWTQLGYTYDWSTDNPSHVGLSEFVIRRDADIVIAGKETTQLYCSVD